VLIVCEMWLTVLDIRATSDRSFAGRLVHRFVAIDTNNVTYVAS
jgi:hypothetical protein